MIKLYAQIDENKNVLNIGTVHESVLFTEVILIDPVIDLTKLSGYQLAFEEDGVYMSFNEDKYNTYLEEQKKVEAIEDGKIRMEQLTIRSVLETASEEDAYIMRYLYDEWDGNGVSYKKDQRLRYKDKLYKVLLDHTSQGDWIPGATPSLYVEVSDPAIEYPEWKKPTGAHDAYAKDDKVTYNGKKYISTIDANTYSPEEYPAGWKLVEE